MTCNTDPVLPSEDLDLKVADFTNGGSNDMRPVGTYTWTPDIPANKYALVYLVKFTGISDNISDLTGWFSQPALVNGVKVVVTRRGNTPYDYALFKSSFDMLFYSNEGIGDSVEGVGNTGQSIVGAHMHFEKPNRFLRGDKIEVVVQDDISSMVSFRGCAFYKEIDFQ